MVGDDSERIYRDELPPWDVLFKHAAAAVLELHSRSVGVLGVLISAKVTLELEISAIRNPA